MKKMLTVVAASLACAIAGAQTANFEGLSGALNLNRSSTTTKFTFEDSYVNYGGQSWSGSIQAAYGFAVSPSIVVSVGGTYGFGRIDSGGENFGLGLSEFRAKKAYSLYVEPGFLLNEKTLAYGKLSYEGAKGAARVFDSAEYSKTIKGTGFGFGVRTMIDKNMFIQVELKQVGYRTIDIGDGYTYKPKSTAGTFGIGMKF